MCLDVPAGHVPRSRATRVMRLPPADATPGAMVPFDVDLPLEPPLPPIETIEKGGRKAADLRTYISARAKSLHLSYSREPNPLNPARTWPIREQLTFANLRPEYFQLPDREGLFSKLFGFDDWDTAMLVFERIYSWDVQARTRRNSRRRRLSCTLGFST